MKREGITHISLPRGESNIMLNDTQKEKAHKWYRDHHQHVNKLIDNIEDKSLKYPPTDTEDKARPELWKPAHWNWFLNGG